jgi:hypothetical protein
VVGVSGNGKLSGPDGGQFKDGRYRGYRPVTKGGSHRSNDLDDQDGDKKRIIPNHTISQDLGKEKKKLWCS